MTRCAVVSDLSRPDAVGQWVSWKLAISPWGVCGGDPTLPIPLKQGSEGQDNENATSAAKCVHTDRISGDSEVIMRDAVRAFRTKGVTILLVEQNAALALSLADRGYVMERGRITLANTAASLRRNPEVVASYLGSAQQDISARGEAFAAKSKQH